MAEAEAAKDSGLAKAVATSTAKENQLLLRRRASAPCRQSIHSDPRKSILKSRSKRKNTNDPVVNEWHPFALSGG